MRTVRVQRAHRIYRRNRIFVFSAIIAILIVSSLFMIKAQASRRSSDKQVTSVMIEEGDSLWSIASRYYDKDTETISDVIEEIKDINGLTSDKLIKGMYIIVPYSRDTK